MNYEAATKQVRAAKKPDSYLVFTFNYGDRYVLPHKDGVALMQTLALAEQMPSYFSDTKGPEIKQVSSGSIRVEALSQADYEDIKIAALLGIPLDDFKKAKKQTPEPS